VKMVDRAAAMLAVFCCLVILLLAVLAVFANAPVISSCVFSLLYALYLFCANEAHEVHHAQEYENRFWTVFAILLSTAAVFATDSPIAFIGRYYPILGFTSIIVCGYLAHTYNRHAHRQALGSFSTRRLGTSIDGLSELGVPARDLLSKINSLLQKIDQTLIPSTINNVINARVILNTEREIISIFDEANPKALNYLITTSQLGLLFYKIKDHRRFNHRHRTQLIELLAVDRVSQLTVHSKVIVLHSLQMMKLPANTKAEHWVRNIILSTKQDELSELKTQADGRGNWYCMSKLIYDDIRSAVVREDILAHIQREAKVQQAHRMMRTRKSIRNKGRRAWKKILSDVDDTLSCSGGQYPAGIDRRYGKKVVYPGVLSFYRELDLGIDGPDEWPSNATGNLVFLSARPHFYKDVTEKQNFAKFKKLRNREGAGMHTIPSLLPGDLTSGTEFILKNDYEPLAQKKFQNFEKYVNIYPEYRHVFVCDNGQGDVRASEIMTESFPDQVEAVYVHAVQDVDKTYKYNAQDWKINHPEHIPFFFTTYPEAALDAAKRKSPLISVAGLRRICHDTVNDFYMIQTKDWPSQRHRSDRREELNQSLYQCNRFLETCNHLPVALLEADRLWRDRQRVSTPYGNGTVLSFDTVFDLYEVELDWRPLDLQVEECERHQSEEKIENISDDASPAAITNVLENGRPPILETVEEVDEETTEVLRASSRTIRSGSGEGSDGTSNVCARPLEGYNEADGCAGNFSNGNLHTKTGSNGDVGLASSLNKAEASSVISEAVEGFSEDRRLNAPECTLIESPSFVRNKRANSHAIKHQAMYHVQHPVIAKIQGRFLKKYIPPLLPIFTKDENEDAFSYWNSSESEVKKKPEFSKGDKCSTPFGSGCISEYRETDGIVVITFSSWSAQAYLNEKIVKHGDVQDQGGSIIGNFLWKITVEASDKVLLSKPQQRPKEIVEFPYATDSILQTPFGTGKISRPLSQAKQLDNPMSLASSTSSQGGKSSQFISDAPTFQNGTIGIDIISWVLADDTHPKLYCTVEIALQWKIIEGKNKSNASGIFSVLEYVSQSMKRLTQRKNQESKVPEEILVRRFEQYYKDGAVVTTPFGQGTVKSFRKSDGVYAVALMNWKMKGGLRPKIFLMKDAISNYVSNGCHEGYPVLTSLGVSGNLASVQPTTGIHIVTVPNAGMVCYLQPKDVLCPLKAAVTEDVLTQYGEGKVEKYRLIDNIYEINLNGSAKLYAKPEAIDRTLSGIEDSAGFGVNWLLRSLFFGSRNSENSDGNGSLISRSRSNSIISLSAASQTSRGKK